MLSELPSPYRTFWSELSKYLNHLVEMWKLQITFYAVFTNCFKDYFKQNKRASIWNNLQERLFLDQGQDVETMDSSDTEHALLTQNCSKMAELQPHKITKSRPQPACLEYPL